GTDGRPGPRWDATTGAIDQRIAQQWKACALRDILESNWAELGPKLKGKIHIWVGEADDYFLNNAVHRLDAFLSHARPAYEGSIVYGPGQGHCWMESRRAFWSSRWPSGRPFTVPTQHHPKHNEV